MFCQGKFLRLMQADIPVFMFYLLWEDTSYNCSYGLMSCALEISSGEGVHGGEFLVCCFSSTWVLKNAESYSRL